METLSGSTIDRLLDDLRHQVGCPSTCNNHSISLIGKSLSITALTGLLFLGLATACDSDDGKSCEQEAEEHGLTGDDAEFYCELMVLINEADISQSDRSALLECMPDLSEWERTYLIDQFQNASDEELSDMLEDLLDPCQMCDPDTWDCH